MALTLDSATIATHSDSDTGSSAANTTKHYRHNETGQQITTVTRACASYPGLDETDAASRRSC